MNANDKALASGQAGRAIWEGDRADSEDKVHDTSADVWMPHDHHDLATCVTDFLMCRIESVGISEDLSRAVNFLKRESEKLAYSQQGGRNGY